MSEDFAAPPPPAPAVRTRPAIVTVAGGLLGLVALCSLVYLGASIAVLGAMSDAFEEVFAGTELEDAAGLLAASTLITGVVYALVGITLAILAIANQRGSNGVRIATWVVGGIGLCCGGLSLLSTAFSDVTMPGAADSPDLPDPAETERILAAHVPDWFEPVILASTVVGVLALAAALLLLALPAANEFFRKPEQPSVPPPSYPPVG